MWSSLKIRALVLLWVLFSCFFEKSSLVDATFSCQSTRENDYSNCFDNGVAHASSGGRVFVRLYKAKNLANKDNSAPAAGKSDPQVVFKVGSDTYESTVKRNTLEPDWKGERVDIGVLKSGTKVEISIKDFDIGVESYSFAPYNDRTLGSGYLRVPFCHMFHNPPGSPDDDARGGGSAAVEEISGCNKPFGCAADETDWAMPHRKLCRESGYINFEASGDNPRYWGTFQINTDDDDGGTVSVSESEPEVCISGGTCLSLAFEIVPFQLSIPRIDPDQYLGDDDPEEGPVLVSVATEDPVLTDVPLWPASDCVSCMGGAPMYNSGDAISFPGTSSKFAGAIMLRQKYTPQLDGEYNKVRFWVAFNYAADLYTCRLYEDDIAGPLKWLRGWSSSGKIADQVRLESGAIYYCYKLSSPGITRNRWGGYTDNPVPFYTNEMKKARQQSNYIVLAIPQPDPRPADPIEINYTMSIFMAHAFTHGLVFAWISFWVFRLMNKLDFRIGRVTPWLAGRVSTGDEQTILAQLFLSYDETPCNVEFRLHLFDAGMITYFFIALPSLILLAWGLSYAYVGEPSALGHFIAWAGNATLFMNLALRAWESMNWRMAPSILSYIVMSFVCFFIFLVATVFSDPAHQIYGKPIDFTALSLLFATINCIPLILLVFKQDKTYKHDTNEVFKKMSEAVYDIQEAAGKRIKRKADSISANKAIHALLGEAYTLNPKCSAFRFSTVLKDLGREKAEEAQAGATAAISSKFANRGDSVYTAALFIMFLYFCIAAGSRLRFLGMAMLHICALLLFDTIHTALSHGDVVWNPAFKILLLVVGRVLVMGSPTEMWLMNYSLAYIVYGVSLVYEVINVMLPMLSKREAGVAAYSGNASGAESNPDIAGTPTFCFALLTFAFTCLLLLCAFGDVSEQLPLNDVDMPLALGGGGKWPVYAFGLIAVLAVTSGGLLMATVRAYQLKKLNLLRGWTRTGYFLREDFDVPLCLAIVTEVAIITSGLMIYATTGSSLILILCFFVPPVIGCFAYAYKVWLANDYDLVIWPPQEKDGDGGDTPSDMEVAFNMINKLFGSEADKPVALVAAVAEQNNDNPESGSPPVTPADGSSSLTKEVAKQDAFTLPPLDPKKSGKSDSIKMPPLPLKSVLRRKRQQGGELKLDNDKTGVNSQKVEALLKGNRSGGKNTETTADGLSGEVLSGDDPWLEFDGNDKADEQVAIVFNTGPSKEDEARQALLAEHEGMPKDRIGFARHPYVLSFIAWLKKSRAGRKLLELTGKCARGMGIAGKYKKVESEEGEGSDAETESEDEFDIDSDEEGDGKKEHHGPMHENFDRMPFWYAYFFGYLINSEYAAVNSFLGGMLLLMFMGIAISDYVQPDYLGHLIWVYAWIFITIAIPLYRYFRTYAFDETFWTFIGFDALFHLFFCVFYFVFALEEDTGVVESLWLLDYFFYAPVVVYCVYEFIKWVDDGYKIEKLDKDGDGDVTWEEYIEYFKAYPIIVCLLIIFNWQMWTWMGDTTGWVFFLFMVLSGFSYVFIRDWATNDFFLSPEYILLGNVCVQVIVFITIMASAFSAYNPLIAMCVFFFTVMFRQAMKLVARYMNSDPEEVIFFSPNVLPVYSYDPKINDVVDENVHAKQFINMLLTGVMWGATFSILLYPVSVGIGICSVFLLAVAVSVSATMTYVPFKLGQYHTLLTTANIKESASDACDKYVERRTPIKLEASHFFGEEADDWDKKPKSALEKMKDSNAIVNANSLIEEVRGLTYIQDDTNDGVVDVSEAVEVKVGIVGRYWRRMKGALTNLFNMLPIKSRTGWVKHSHSLMDVFDAMGVALIASRGSLGWMGFEGGVKFTLKKMKEEPRLQFLYRFVSWLDDYDEHGNRKSVVQLPEGFDTLTVLARLNDIECAIDHTFKEEMRCSIHFISLLLVAADAKLQREQVLFQKFLRENRFRLASNGISPPSEVFSSSSFASVDIGLVAVWLSTLTEEERERFQMLKSTFSEEQRERDAAIDHEDAMFKLEALELLEERKERDLEMNEKLQRELKSKMDQRIRVFSERLLPGDQIKFESKKKIWCENADIQVEESFADLYAKFREAIMSSDDEATEYARQVLGEIENTQVNCRAGEFGRQYQYSDPEFTATMDLVTGCQNANKVKEWKSGLGISDVSVLFEGGTDADDVEAGIFADEWLLSAISMLAAAGGEGEVNDQVINLFVGHKAPGATAADDMVYSTDVGAYCVRLFKSGVWNPMVIDDLFPVLHETMFTNENRGMAGAHTKEAAELWVSLIEKAFAKYYGGYRQLERGFVHHALSDMTGSESDCIMLAHASRGGGKRALWDRLIRFKRDGYILGAGTASGALADKEILEMGIIFNAAYTIYDVQLVDGHQLLKLRNPPGDHDEWQGDWSDKSPLWTRRLKAKLGWVDEDDNTFWMAFDDFCNVFRHLYVCKWYNPRTWPAKTMPGQWSQKIPYVIDPKVQDDVAKTRSKGLTVQGVDITAGEADAPPKFINTAGGLPTKHNPGCHIENNPHYALHIYRPCEVRITLSQTDSRGSVNGEALPCAVFVLRNEHPTRPMRIKDITRDNLVTYSGEPTDERSQHVYTALKPGLYTILPCVYKAGMEGNYTLSILSNTRTKLYSYWPPRWMTIGGDEDDLTDLDASQLFKMGAKMAQAKVKELKGDVETGEGPGQIRSKPPPV